MAERMPDSEWSERGIAMTREGGIGALAVVVAAAVAILALPASGASIPDPLPDPDGKPADMSKKVQVYILMGQSNMLGFGKVGMLKGIIDGKGKYPYLVDDAGNWTVRKDVRNVRVMNFKDYLNDWMTISGKHIGPEIGIGHYIGHVTDEPVLILKSCIGNRALGWDLLPPGVGPYEYGGKTQAGYRGTPGNPKGNGEKVQGQWYAGKQYDDDTDSAKQVLANLGKYYPGARGYVVAGFLFWQGAKDKGNAAWSEYYERNLVQFIKALRKDFNAPNGLFVVATLGEAAKGGGGNLGKITAAQLAVDGRTGKYKEFKGNVASVYSKPFCHGGGANGHYSGNVETYMDVGEAMGKAMAELIVSSRAKKEKKKAEKKKAAAPPKPKVDPNIAKAERLFKSARDAEKMHQRSVAKTFYKMVIDRYPGTPAAEKAAERLEKLK